MPIQGLTTVQHLSGFSVGNLPTLGKLFKGAPKTNAGKVGKDLNEYFRFEGNTEQFPDINAQFAALYGEKPTHIPRLRLIGDTVDEIFPSFNESWNYGGLTCRCDGQRILTIADETGKRTYPENMRCFKVVHPNVEDACACVPTGYLTFLLPELVQASGYFGTVRLTLHSPNELREIATALHVLGQFTAPASVSSLTMRLGRRPQEFPVEIDGKQRKVTKWLVYLQPEQESLQTLLAGNYEQSPPEIDAPPNTLALPPEIPTGYEPYALQEKIAEFVAAYEADGISNDEMLSEEDALKARQHIALTLNGMLAACGLEGNTDTWRHAILLFLFGVESSTMFTPAMYKAFGKWTDGQRGATAKAEVCAIMGLSEIKTWVDEWNTPPA